MPADINNTFSGQNNTEDKHRINGKTRLRIVRSDQIVIGDL